MTTNPQSVNSSAERLPVVVTGANGDIGREICRALADENVPLIMACRTRKKFEETLAAITGESTPRHEAEFMQLDLNSSQSVEDAAHSLQGKRLAGIIHNAGTMQRRFTLSADGPEVTLNVNYFNTRLLTERLLPQVVSGGAVVFTTSLTRRFWRRRPLPEEVTEHTFGQLRTYALSKALITAYASQLVGPAGSRGVRVCCADPGVVDSGMITMHRWFDPLADLVFRPFIRSPRQGAVPALRALHSGATGLIFTLRSSSPLR